MEAKNKDGRKGVKLPRHRGDWRKIGHGFHRGQFGSHWFGFSAVKDCGDPGPPPRLVRASGIDIRKDSLLRSLNVMVRMERDIFHPLNSFCVDNSMYDLSKGTE